MSTQTHTRIPISTLTKLPCPHGPGSECMECVGEGAFRFEPLAPEPPEPLGSSLQRFGWDFS